MPRRRPVLILLVLLAGCTGVPEGVQPVTGFELERYLGTWYEIARLDHPFERGLSRVTAEYSRRDDGGVRVQNRGFNNETGDWEDVEGKAYFIGPADRGSQVSLRHTDAAQRQVLPSDVAFAVLQVLNGTMAQKIDGAARRGRGSVSRPSGGHHASP